MYTCPQGKGSLLSSREGGIHPLLKGRDDYNDVYMDIYVYMYVHIYICICMDMYIHAEAQAPLKGRVSLIFSFFYLFCFFSFCRCLRPRIDSKPKKLENLKTQIILPEHPT